MVSARVAARRAEVEEGVKSHPLVAAATQELGAEIRDVRLPAELDSPAVSLREATDRPD